MEIYYNKAINKLSSTLDKDVLNFANEIIESWKNLNKVEISDFVILHNDLYSRNIIVNPDNKRISWIIDFSDMTEWDRCIDFVSLYFENSDFAKLVIKKYEEINWFKLDIQKVDLYAKIFALNEFFWNDANNKPIADRWIFVNN